MSRISIVLEGRDGSVWDVGDPASPVHLENGLGGLHLPKVSHRWSTTARRAGRLWKGSVVDSRAFTMHVTVGDMQAPFRRGQDWRDLDAAFWAALSTDEVASLVVNGDRKLVFRLDEDNQLDFVRDPARIGRTTYPIACITDDPAWLGATSTTLFPFQATEVTDYYGGAAGLGPPFIISEPSLFTEALVANPGDLETWPSFTATGPASAFRIGVAGHVIEPPFPLQQGDVVIFDAQGESITDAQGNDLWPLMGYAPVDWAPLAPGGLVPVEIGMDDPGDGASIAVTVTPRFRRAWSASSGTTPIPIPVPTSGGGDGGFGTSAFGTSSFGGVA